MNEIRRLAVRITGRVQGVGYRHWAAHRARLIGLTGWIANLPDGSVTAVAEGPRAGLEVWLSDLREGPPLARVESVSPVYTSALGEFTSFEQR